MGLICGGRPGGVEGYGCCRDGDGKGSCEGKGVWGNITGGCAGLLGEFVILSMVSRRDGTNCASTRGKSASWLLRFEEEDLLFIPLAFESRLFRNDMRETRLGSVEDADDEVGSCPVGVGAGADELSGSARDRSAVVGRQISASTDLSSSGCGCVRPAAAA